MNIVIFKLWRWFQTTCVASRLYQKKSSNITNCRDCSRLYARFKILITEIFSFFCKGKINFPLTESSSRSFWLQFFDNKNKRNKRKRLHNLTNSVWLFQLVCSKIRCKCATKRLTDSTNLIGWSIVCGLYLRIHRCMQCCRYSSQVINTV